MIKSIMMRITILVFYIFMNYDADANQNLVDKNATKETKALYQNLMQMQNKGNVIFGQQDATVYGRKWVGDSNRSDSKDVSGDHPGLIGLDFLGLETTDKNSFNAKRNELLQATKDTYSRGGIVTFCWHMANPVNGGSFYWKDNPKVAVAEILPNGKFHHEYKRYLKVIASFVNDCRGEKAELIPIIFRPFHEYDGDWFWWGDGHRTKDEFISLWKYTVTYLRDELRVRNFLYAFSPDCKFTTKEEYLEYYPGDNYVDIMGMDNYWDFRPDGANNPHLAENKLSILSNLATERNKVAALTETGLEGITNPTWYTNVLYPILSRVKVAYAQVWRNANESATHYYVPTKGHPAVADFKKFSKKRIIYFEKKLPNMYEYNSKSK